VLAALGDVIDQRAVALQGFVAAYRRALDYVTNPSHWPVVISQISQGRNINESDAEVVLRSELSDVGLSRDVDHIDPVAANAVIRLRVKNGGLELPTGENQTVGLVEKLTTRLDG
jgi:hypothetical protein